MKDFDVKFSLKNLFRETQKEITAFQAFMKSHVISGLGGYFATGSKIALWIGIGGIALDVVLHFVSLEEKK